MAFVFLQKNSSNSDFVLIPRGPFEKFKFTWKYEKKNIQNVEGFKAVLNHFG
jgi:hypothetical protein